MRHVFTSIFSLSLFVTTSCANANPMTSVDRENEGTQPNIIVIMADDLGWADVSINGANLIQTPNIDRIGNEGVRLTSFYAGANVCTPSRAALLTGRYPIRSGMQHVVHPHSQFGLPQSEITIPEMLKEAGYSTGMVGKWHLGHLDQYWPTSHGFDSFFGVAYSNDMQPFDLYESKTIVQSPVDQSELTERYANAASEFIATHADEPFFLYYAETFPHIPLYVPEEATNKSAAGQYGDVVEHLDWGVGEILKALEDAGIAENTLIIVTSDNGPWFEGDSGPYRDRKGGTYDGGYRVPFLARWPAVIAENTESDAMTMSIDLLPTFAEIADANQPTDRAIDGKNIISVLQGSDQTPHDILYFFNGNDIAAARDQQYRLVLSAYYKSIYIPFERFGAKLLFDLVRDPEERFSYVREHPEVVNRLQVAVDEMREEVADMVFDPIAPRSPEAANMQRGPQLESSAENDL